MNDSQREPASGASIESKPKAKLPKNKKKASSASVRRTTPTWSEWTILIYLSGHEDGIVGGETVFYAEEGKGKSKQQREIVPPLARGSVLFHRSVKLYISSPGLIKPYLIDTERSAYCMRVVLFNKAPNTFFVPTLCSLVYNDQLPAPQLDLQHFKL